MPSDRDILVVDSNDANNTLPSLLAAVEGRGQWVRICRNEKLVADLRPISGPFTQYPELMRGGKINYDPTEGATEDEWPEDLR